MENIMENYIEIKIKADLKNVAVARVAISTFITELDVTIDDLMDIKTAISEAVTNAIEHGYGDEIKKEEIENDNFVTIRGYIKSEDEDYIKIEVEDFGIGIEDIALATTPAYTSKPELEHAGMGFTIMETFMDEVFIDSKKEEGTKVTLTKTLRKKKSKIV